jgi:hypothetical protein
MAEKEYKTFWTFYPYYLREHSDPSNRIMHFVGTGLVIASFITGLITMKWYFFAIIPVLGYGFAWVGHFFIEKNRPATFTYPLWSLGSDFAMFWHILTGQIQKKLDEAHQASQK